MERQLHNRPSSRRLALIISLIALLTITGCATPGQLAAPVLGPPASILGWSPGVTQDVPPSAPLAVYFTRAVNHGSVERSWRLTPRAPGTFRWSDTSVAFTPAHTLRPGASYRLTVGHSAREDRGRPLTNALDISFSTG